MQALRNELYRPWFFEDKWGFEIIDGEFSGVVVQIEKIEFAETDDGRVDLDYHIISKPETVEELKEDNQIFAHTVELIMSDILREAVNHYEQTRNDNSSEPSQQ